MREEVQVSSTLATEQCGSQERVLDQTPSEEGHLKEGVLDKTPTVEGLLKGALHTQLDSKILS